MSIKVIVELQVREDRLSDIEPRFASLLQGTRSRDDNEGVTVHVDQDSPSTIVLLAVASAPVHVVSAGASR
jgi:quinol monooxygenase YgiN